MLKIKEKGEGDPLDWFPECLLYIYIYMYMNIQSCIYIYIDSVSTQQLDVRPCQYIYLLDRLYRWASPVWPLERDRREATPNKKMVQGLYKRHVYIAALGYSLEAPSLFSLRRKREREREKKNRRGDTVLCPVATDLIINENHHH